MLNLSYEDNVDKVMIIYYVDKIMIKIQKMISYHLHCLRL